MKSRGTLAEMITVAAIVVLAQPTVASAADGAILAVFDMEDRGSGLSSESLTNLTDYLAVLMAEGGYQVVPRDQIKARLKAQAASSMKECYDQSCQVELGRELAAQKTLATQIFKIGSKCRVTGTMFNLRKAATEKAASAKSSCDEEGLGLALEKIAKKLARKKVDVTTLRKAAKEAEAKAEADRKAREEADRKAKAEADRKAKAEADRKAKAEADRKAKAEADRKAEVEADRKAKQEADRRAKAEADRDAEEETSGDDAGTPSTSRVADQWWNVGFGVGVAFPSPGEGTGVELIYGSGDELILDVGFGMWLRAYADFKLSPFFSLGLSLGHHSSEAESTNAGEHNNLNVSYLMLVPKLHYPVTDTIDLHLAVGLGAALMHSSGQYQTTNNDSADLDQLATNLGLEISLGIAWYLTESFGLSFDLGIVGGLVGELEDETEMGVDEYDLGGPYFFLSISGEFGG